jgi:phenylacetate-CoA ligase
VRKLYYLQKVWRQQWMRPEELRRLQDAKLRAMVRHAYANVPFYRRAWKAAGVRPEDVRGAEDMRKLPVISRADIRSNANKFLAVGVDKHKCHTNSTSGSSGIPLEMFFDPAAFDYLEAIYARALFAVGYRPWHRFAYFWYPPLKRMKFYEHFGIMKKSYVLTADDEEKQLAELARIKPDAIYAFPNTLFLVARLMTRMGIDSVRPKLIICHAELMTDDVRKALQDAFDCDVFNEYGSTEFNRMGWDCEFHKGFHVDSDSILAEFLKDGEPAAAGENSSVVLTGLVNMAMPLIRYDIGDVGAPSDGTCPCGRGLPLMNIVEGRADDFIVLPSGRAIPPRRIMHSLYNAVLHNDEVFRLKVVQEKEDRIRVYVTRGKEAGERTVENIRSAVTKALGEPVDVDVRFVDAIEKNSHGKLRTVESKVRMRL